MTNPDLQSDRAPFSVKWCAWQQNVVGDKCQIRKRCASASKSKMQFWNFLHHWCVGLTNCPSTVLLSSFLDPKQTNWSHSLFFFSSIHHPQPWLNLCIRAFSEHCSLVEQTLLITFAFGFSIGCGDWSPWLICWPYPFCTLTSGTFSGGVTRLTTYHTNFAAIPFLSVPLPVVLIPDFSSVHTVDAIHDVYRFRAATRAPIFYGGNFYPLTNCCWIMHVLLVLS